MWANARSGCRGADPALARGPQSGDGASTPSAGVPGDGLCERSRHHGVAPAELSSVSWPVCTARLRIRPATPADVGGTWRFRRLPAVDQWLSSRSTTLEGYRTNFVDPDRLSKMLVVELDGAVIGDLMLAIKDAWAQSEVQDQARGVQAELGLWLDPTHHGDGYALPAEEWRTSQALTHP